MPTPSHFDRHFNRFKKYFGRRKPSIQEIVREPTAGGIVFRYNSDNKLEILLIQDAKDRWTIPKGHIEKGETAVQTARREIGEEAGLPPNGKACPDDDTDLPCSRPHQRQ